MTYTERSKRAGTKLLGKDGEYPVACAKNDRYDRGGRRESQRCSKESQDEDKR